MIGERLLATVCVLVTLATFQVDAQNGFVSPWSFECQDHGTVDAKCTKVELAEGEEGKTLNACKLTCGLNSAIWPAPSTTPTIGTEISRFTTSQISELITAPSEVFGLMEQNLEIFKNHLDMYHPDYDFVSGTAPWSDPEDPAIQDHILRIEISISSSEDRLSLTTDESYSLNVLPSSGQTTAVVTAATFFGARHGLETLSQLINYDEVNDCLQIVNSVVITNDSPQFAYRGLILDTARNYVDIAGIKRTIDAMSGSKVNTFHWHITDSHSFPFVMESLPKMHRYGAYSGRKIYTADDIRDIVEYARVRGVRVLPEFDAPAHVGSGWEWGPQEGYGNLAVCVNKQPWWMYCVEPPCGQLNLANPEMYTILGMVYQEFVNAFGPLDLFHYGGDEVNIDCWNTTQEIVDWMLSEEVTEGALSVEAYHTQWGIFQDRAYNLLTQANGGVDITGIIWTSGLTTSGRVGEYLDKNKYVIQIWTTGDDPIITELLQEGYDVIFSNYDAWYLDCGFGAWVGDGNNWCSPYKGWQEVYSNSPYDLVGDSSYNDQIIGGEAALWTEQADNKNLDSRLWPRVSALGERLWTNPSGPWEDAESRMVHHRERLVQRGVMADSIQPEWCHQNEGGCPAWGST